MNGERKMSGFIDILAQVSPASLAARLAPGPGFSVLQGGSPLQWTLVQTQESGKDRWALSYESSQDLAAVATVELDRDRHAAAYEVTLTNAGQGSATLESISAMSLAVSGMQSTPRVMSLAGGIYANRYPARSSWWASWDLLLYPSPLFGSSIARSIEFHSTERDLWSSSRNLPIVMVSPDIEWDAPGFFFGMEWSSRWDVSIGYDGSTESLIATAGPQVKDLELDAGESLELPRVHVGFFESGFEGGTNACRRYIRDSVTPRHNGQRVVPPVAYTMWMGLRRQFTEEDLYPQVDAAADMGAEIFLVDDWFVGNHPRGTGNWEADPAKFPNGLEPIAQHVRSKGMGFGLFFEPDFAEPGTRIVREHPEFFFDSPAAEVDPMRPLSGEHGACHMYDFSQPEARQYMIGLLGDFIERYDLRYIRWDSNRYGMITMRHVDATGKFDFAYLRGLYSFWEELLDRYPRLMLECIAAGGNRFDLGTMRRTHVGWFNDLMEHPHVYHTMQLGANSFLPAYYLGSSIGWPQTSPADQPDMVKHTDAGLTDLSFLSRMAGFLILHGYIAHWPPEMRERARKWIGVYKDIRHLLVEDYYRLLPQPQSEADWDAGQFCRGTEEGVVFVFRWAGPAENRDLALRSLEAGRSYAVRDQATGKEEKYSGESLTAQGLPVSLPPNSAKLYSYRVQDG